MAFDLDPDSLERDVLDALGFLDNEFGMLDGGRFVWGGELPGGRIAELFLPVPRIDEHLLDVLGGEVIVPEASVLEIVGAGFCHTGNVCFRATVRGGQNRGLSRFA